ncbi:MAG: GNAT family N-acetyltransferase [Candidatus Kapabacteria bacterium]|nr:GNAT family N-acetyltransferase [Candidatus Kapabacteria bacterium]
MINLKRTNSENLDFQKLVVELDKDLAIRDGADHSFYSQFNKIDSIKYVVIAYHNQVPVGCGAIKVYEKNVMEVKRMYVPIEKRGNGIASIVLKELENWAKELGFQKCILETGIKQPEAIGLYKKNNYNIIPNYGQYANVESSVCFEKILFQDQK